MKKILFILSFYIISGNLLGQGIFRSSNASSGLLQQSDQVVSPFMNSAILNTGSLSLDYSRIENINQYLIGVDLKFKSNSSVANFFQSGSIVPGFKSEFILGKMFYFLDSKKKSKRDTLNQKIQFLLSKKEGKDKFGKLVPESFKKNYSTYDSIQFAKADSLLKEELKVLKNTFVFDGLQIYGSTSL